MMTHSTLQTSPEGRPYTIYAPRIRVRLSERAATAVSDQVKRVPRDGRALHNYRESRGSVRPCRSSASEREAKQILHSFRHACVEAHPPRDLMTKRLGESRHIVHELGDSSPRRCGSLSARRHRAPRQTLG